LPKPPSKFAGRALALALFLGLCLVAYFTLRQRAEAGKGMPPFSLYAKDRDGLGSAAVVLRKLGWQPIALTRPIQHTHYRGLLILVEPQVAGMFGPTPGLSESDSKGLLSWVGAGNTLLLCGREQTELHDLLHVKLRSDLDVEEHLIHLAEPGEAGGYTDRIDRLEIEGDDSVRADTGVPLWWVDGSPAAVLVRHGAGRVLIVPDPSLLTQRGLSRQDNVLFLYNLAVLDAAPGGPVYFDEYHHGLRSGGGAWGYLRFHEQQGSVLQLLLVALVGIWAVGVRLGPAVARPRETRADAVDYAGAVARIYRRAGVRHVPARALVRDFLGRLTRQLRLRQAAAPAQIVAAWRKQHPDQPPTRLEEVLHGAAELRKVAAEEADMSEQQLFTWTRALDDFAKDGSKRGVAWR
jgi:hypothetical protein